MKNKNKILATAIVVTMSAPAFAACDPDFTGVKLTYITQTGPYIASALTNAAEGWSKQTCGEFEAVEFPWGELYPKIVTSLTAGEEFDGITFPPAWSPDFFPYLEEMPANIRKGADWEDIHTVYRDRLMVWDGKVLSQTMDGDLHALTYRIDLFDDPAEQTAFKSKYGYDLQPPRTWKEYLEIAEFFTRPGDKLWGTVEAFRRGGQQFWFFFSHAASYTNHPDHPGSMFFDPDTMDAQVNNPGWVLALDEYIASSKVSPPNALNFSFGEVNGEMAGGRAAMSIGWGDTGVIAADPEQSQISGNVGSAMLPGATKIYNYKTKRWDDFGQVIRSPFMAFGGWQAGVPVTSTNKEASWHFIQYLTSPQVSGEAAITGGTGVNPYRLSHLNNRSRWKVLFSDREANEYLDAQENSLNAPNVALDMRLPGYFSYTEVLEIELSKALAGDATAQEALDTVAEEWNSLTDEFGREKQLDAYRKAMGL